MSGSTNIIAAQLKAAVSRPAINKKNYPLSMGGGWGKRLVGYK